MKPIELLPYAITALASFFGAWVAARFALSRFYREKVWERKAAAYTAIFEALHFIEQWYSKHQDAYFEQREISDEESKALTKASRDAEAELARRLAAETWLIPNNCRKRLTKLTLELQSRERDWFQYLDTNLGRIYSATDELRDMVHADLHLYSRPRLFASRLIRNIRERRRWRKMPKIPAPLGVPRQ
jgi:hypothetical protein